uniref:ATP synthase complex subunit 8 n=1 Tax=Poecilimon luschani TaxID=473713 RepID=A0A4D6DI36_9ORTH|nr:ATP synthase F0 subunit 8 [Poecilimon luschani]QBZ37721.1 ATP synthase F0 subunit 8 [Poecilimon luschani]
MPQMSPLWWLLLFFVFSASLILFSLINYFMIINEPATLDDDSPNWLKHHSLNWKW